MRRAGRGTRPWAAPGLAIWLGLALMLCLPATALADDCSGPSDCQAPPGNADAATGLAAAMAVLAIVLATASRRREQRRIEHERDAGGADRPAATPARSQTATADGGQAGASFDRSSDVGPGYERRAGTGFAPAGGLSQTMPGESSAGGGVAGQEGVLGGQAPGERGAFGRAGGDQAAGERPRLERWETSDQPPVGQPSSNPREVAEGPLGGRRGGGEGSGLGRSGADQWTTPGETSGVAGREGPSAPSDQPMMPGAEPPDRLRTPPGELPTREAGPGGGLGGARGGEGLGRPEAAPESSLYERRETVEWQAADEGSGRERPTDRGPGARPPADGDTPDELSRRGPSGSGQLGGAGGGQGPGRAPGESLEDPKPEPPPGLREDSGRQAPPGPDRAARRSEDDPERRPDR